MYQISSFPQLDAQQRDEGDERDQITMSFKSSDDLRLR